MIFNRRIGSDSSDNRTQHECGSAGKRKINPLLLMEAAMIAGIGSFAWTRHFNSSSRFLGEELEAVIDNLKFKDDLDRAPYHHAGMENVSVTMHFRCQPIAG